MYEIIINGYAVLFERGTCTECGCSDIEVRVLGTERVCEPCIEEPII